MEDFYEFMDEIDFQARFRATTSITDFLEDLDGYWGENHPYRERVEELQNHIADLEDCIWLEHEIFLQIKSNLIKQEN